MKSFRIVNTVFLIFLVPFSMLAQTENDAMKPCLQDRAEKLQLIKKAEENQYNIRHIYIVGNTYTRHRTFRKHMVKAFNEGFIFTEQNLMTSIKGINKLKSIRPINLDDVKVRLEKDAVRGWNVIDFDICVEQKRK